MGNGGLQLDGMKAAGPAALLQRRLAHQRAVAKLYACRRSVCLAPVGMQGVGAIQTDSLEKVVLQKDFLNVVGGVDSQSNGLIEVEVTRDTDGGMRFYADVDVHLTAKNTSGGTLTKGTPVYVTGSVGATTTVEVSSADAGNALRMPAIGLLEQDLLNNETGRCIAVGVLGGLNTAGFTINQTVFVAVGGGLTGTRPTAASALVQNIGRVTRVHATTGEILVLGAGRTNDVPNYNATRLLGRGTASAGPAQEITVGTGLLMTGTTLSVIGGLTDAFTRILVAGQPDVIANSGSGTNLELVAGTNITLTTDDTLKTVTIDAAGGGGGGGTGAAGRTTVNFGAFPGGSDAETVVTGQTGITATSVVQAWIVAQDTADHSADEHRIEPISVCAGNIVAGVGFTIYAQSNCQLNEPLLPAGVSTFRSAVNTVYGDAGRSIGGIGTRIYGQWTVHWRWS